MTFLISWLRTPSTPGRAGESRGWRISPTARLPTSPPAPQAVRRQMLPPLHGRPHGVSDPARKHEEPGWGSGLLVELLFPNLTVVW